MTEDAQALWRWIQTELLGSKDTANDWKNTLDYGITVTETDADGWSTKVKV